MSSEFLVFLDKPKSERLAYGIHGGSGLGAGHYFSHSETKTCVDLVETIEFVVQHLAVPLRYGEVGYNWEIWNEAMELVANGESLYHGDHFVNELELRTKIISRVNQLREDQES